MEIKNLVNHLEWHPTRRWRIRQLSSIRKIIVHQELGESSIENVNAYHISTKNHISPKGCPRICYHYGIRKNGEVVQMNELSSVVWHTSGHNTSGIGIMMVGNFSGLGNTTAQSEPTSEQLESLAQLIIYLQNAFNLTNQDVYGHYHFGKPSCPGYTIQEWVESKRNELSSNIENVQKSISEIQKRLNQLGYTAGVVDGIMGVKTLSAIRNFQSDNHLIVDGVVGPQTWKNLLSLTQ